MTTLPSKELLSEVWGSEVTSIEKVTTMWDMQVLPFWVKEKTRIGDYNDKKYHISIETISYICKKWALNKGYELRTSTRGVVDVFFVKSNYEFIDNEYNCFTEHEAIFKKCEWIMEQTK